MKQQQTDNLAPTQDNPAPDSTSPDSITPRQETIPQDAIQAVTKRHIAPADPDAMDIKPGDNARYVRYAMASWNLPPIDISDPDQVWNRITEYFSYCEQNDRKPQLVGMANWLGISRDTLNSWKRGEYRRDTHSDIIQKAVSALEEMWSEYMLNGKINPASGIFLSKNWFGYRDEQQVVVTPNNPMETGNPDEVRSKYVNAVPDD